MEIKKILKPLAVTTLLAVAVVGITFIFIRITTKDKGGELILPNTSQTTSDKAVEPTVSEKEILGKFIIIPNNFALSPEEIAVIQKHAKTIILDNPSEDYATSVTQSFPNLIVSRIGENLEYTFCNISSVAMTTQSADPSVEILPYIAKGNCGGLHIIANLLKTSCSLSNSLCQREYLINLNSEAYYYNTSSPLLALAKAPLLSLDSPYGTVILDWTDNTEGILHQNSYSFEVLNTKGSRLYASGKVTAANTGDYFSPFFIVPVDGLTFKLRLWLQYGTVKFKEPLIISTAYSFQKVPTPTLSVAPAIRLSSWIPDWGMQDGIDSVKANPRKWDTISPVWFVPNNNGLIEHKDTTNSSTLTKLLQSNNIKNIPTISLFDADVLKEILRKNKTKHINEILKLVTSNNYDGIDLDYESTYEDDAALLLEFPTELSVKLHEQGKVLIFTAAPKIDDREIYAFLPQTHKAQDWKAIGAVVDEFRIMAYDYTGQTSLQPGPLSPIDWNETIIRYAISKMPAEKVVLALPLYSHGWPKPKITNLAGKNNDKSLSSGLAKNTISLQHDSIAYVKSHSAYYREKYDPVVKEVRAEFKYNGVERVMYYLDKKAVNERITLAEKYGIKGVCFWRIGGESL